MFVKAKLLLSDDESSNLEDIRQLRQDAAVLDIEFITWSASQPDEWRPRKIGTISKYQPGSPIFPSPWPGDIDDYLDSAFRLQDPGLYYID